MKNYLVCLLVLFSTILSAAPQSKSGQVGFYQATGVAGTNRFLWDRTNDWLVLTHGALVFGTNKPVVVAEIIRAISDSTAGDPSARTVTIEANDTGAGDYGGAILNVNNAGDASFTLYNHIAFGYGVEFNIRAPDGVTPFSFNATINHTSGSLLSISNLDRGKFDVLYNGMIWSETNKFAHGTITNIWPLTNALAGQLLTSAGGAGAQLYWSTVSASGPAFTDLVWTNDLSGGTYGVLKPVSNTNYTTNVLIVVHYLDLLAGNDFGSRFDVYAFGTNVAVTGLKATLLQAEGLGAGAGILFGGTSWGGYFENQTTNTDSGSWLYDGHAAFGTTSKSTRGGVSSGAAVGGQGVAASGAQLQAALQGFTDTARNGQTNIGVSGAVAMEGFTGAFVGGYFEVDNPGYGNDPILESTVLLLDNRDSGLPLLLARSGNGAFTHFIVNSTNGVSTPAITAYGAGSAPWQFGMATNTVDVLLGATNVVEITVAGVAYLIPAKLK